MTAPKKKLEDHPLWAQWFGVNLIVLPMVTAFVWAPLWLAGLEWFQLGYWQTLACLFSGRQAFRWCRWSIRDGAQ